MRILVCVCEDGGDSYRFDRLTLVPNYNLIYVMCVHVNIICPPVIIGNGRTKSMSHYLPTKLGSRAREVAMGA